MAVAVEKRWHSGAWGAPTSPNSAIRRLAFSRAVTYAGGNAAFWALSVILYEQTQSVTLVAVAALASFSVPAVLSPVAGFLGDHHDRRRVMLVSELAGAICFLGLAIMSGSPAALLALRVLASVASAPLLPATNAALPALVPAADLERANAALSKAGIAGCLIGVAVAGVILSTLGGSFVFVLNTVTFLLSAAVIFSIRGNFRPQLTDKGKMSAGFAFVRQHPVLRPVTVAYAVAFVGIGVTIPAEIVVADEFGVGALGYAALFTIWGVGGLIGASAGKRLRHRPGKVKVIAASALGLALGLLAVSTAPVFAIALLGMAVGGIGEGLWEVTQISLAQRATPDGIRGRVFAAIAAAMQVSIAVGLIVSGVITAIAGAAGAFAIAAAAAIASALILILHAVPAERGIRDKARDEAGQSHHLDPPRRSPKRVAHTDPPPVPIARTA